MTEPRWLDDREREAWLAFLQVSALIPGRLDRALVADAGLSLAEYEVLASLSEAPERQLRMAELAERVLLTKSRLTHTVDRLERAGLVERRPCATDRRGSFAVLTDAGTLALGRAAPGHVATVREALFDHLRPGELGALASGLTRVAAALRDKEAPRGSAGANQ